MSTIQGRLWPVYGDVTLLDADKVEHDPTYFALDGYEPIPAFEPCYAGDAITGWITWEVPRQDVTLLFDNGNYKGSVRITG